MKTLDKINFILNESDSKFKWNQQVTGTFKNKGQSFEIKGKILDVALIPTKQGKNKTFIEKHIEYLTKKFKLSVEIGEFKQYNMGEEIYAYAVEYNGKIYLFNGKNLKG